MSSMEAARAFRPDPTPPTCGGCIFYSDGPKFHESDDDWMGLCRRAPPRVVMGDRGFVVTRFPAVNSETDWCGEFREEG